MAASERNRWQEELRRGWELERGGDAAGAIAVWEGILAVRPRTPEAMHLLGAAYGRTGRAEEGAALLKKAVELQPYNVGALEDWGSVLLQLGRAEEAAEAYQRVAVLAGDKAVSHFNVAIAQQRAGRFGEAIAALRKAKALDPAMLQVDFALGGLLNEVGQEEEGVAALRRVVEGRAGDPVVHSNLLFAMNYHSTATEEAVFAEHARWGARHADPLTRAAVPLPNDRAPERRLRVGYVSADFREHAVAFFFEGLLEAHDAAAVEVICYSDTRAVDAVTERLRAKTETKGQWREISGASDEAVAAMVRADAIDVLVDLGGHTTGNRLLVFARRAGPVQVTYIGYPNTTGVAAMDYRLTDGVVDPPAPRGRADALHVEKLWRLPRVFLCYRPPEQAPEVSPLPADSAGHITFCSFNALAKIRRPTVERWGRVLMAVPGSRLLLKAPRLHDEVPRTAIRQALAGVGVAADRVEFAGGTAGFAEHLALYGRADIALDTFPYHGTTTTCEAMWMGVPVVTLAGAAHRSRVGLTLLTAVGLEEFAAESDERFVHIAAEAARDVGRLRTLRATMRERLRGSPLLDGAGLARAVEEAYRAMWRSWCAAVK